MSEPGTTVERPIGANTFSSIRLDPLADANRNLDDFVKDILEKLGALKDQRAKFYEELRRANTRWANGARGILAVMGAFAFLLTSFAAAVRVLPADSGPRKGEMDLYLMILVIVLYAIMGAITFYEKGTDKSSSYFRQVTTIIAIRDLWNRFQFAVLKELMAAKAAAVPEGGQPAIDAAQAAVKDHIRTLAEAFCADLDKATSAELTDFRTEFFSSLAELDAAAKKGADDTTKQIQEIAAAASKAAADAKTAAEKSAAEAAAAAKAAEDAAKPGFLNVTITGDFDGDVTVSVGASEQTGQGRLFTFDNVPPGIRRVAAKAKKADRPLASSFFLEVKPGIQEVKITL